MTSKNFELETKREKFIKDLIDNPIDNDKFIATFIKKSPHSGEVVFKDKNVDRFAKALWGVRITNEVVIASLSNTGSDLVFEIECENYKNRIDDEIEILNLFSDRNR
jgi:hypothetical protein